MMGVLDPTAARALLPTKLPTMTESAVLYNCWSRFPSTRGMAKRNSFLPMLPSVMRTVLDLSAFIYHTLSCTT